MKLTHRRVKLDEMASFVKEHHRHTAPLRRHMFSIGAYEDWCNPYDLFGVATVDNCSSAWSKRADHTELRRLCTRPGAPPNVASYLLGQVKKAVWGMGYRVLVTYTRQPDEWERAKTKKFLAETNEAYDRGRRKLATEGFDLFPTREAMRHG
jgi:predicted alpha/beta hydrolase